MSARRLLSLGWVLVIALAASEVRASVGYPEQVRDQLGLESIAGPAPGCRVCHADDNGGLRTAVKPFARSLQQAGAKGSNVPSLRAALTRLESDATDSDRDGFSDVQELRDGEDPNAGREDASAPELQLPLPETGCALGAARGAEPASWLSLLLLVGIGWRRRGRRG